MASMSPDRPATEAQPAHAVRTPRISVVMAVLNGEAGLRRALDSIVGQTYPEVEVVVMDGGSTDGSLDILRGYGARIAHWETGRDTGVFNAWNKALDHVTGDWVCFLGADDWYAGPDVMARVAAQITEDEARTTSTTGTWTGISREDGSRMRGSVAGAASAGSGSGAA